MDYSLFKSRKIEIKSNFDLASIFTKIFIYYKESFSNFIT